MGFLWFVTRFVTFPRIPHQKKQQLMWHRIIEGLKLTRVLDHRRVVTREGDVRL